MDKKRCKCCRKKKEFSVFKNRQGVILSKKALGICDDCKVKSKKKREQWLEYSQPNKKKRRKDAKCSQVYLIHCFLEGEEFIKIGMTTKKISERFSKDMPYKYKVISTIKVKKKALLDYEQALHSLFKEHSYRPTRRFSGYTECYTMDCKKEALKFFK